jgi:hypothetical protein
MRQLFETRDHESDFEVFENTLGSITFKSEKTDLDNEFFFVIEKEEVMILIERLKELIAEENL